MYNINTIKPLMDFVRNSRNPQQALQNLAMTNRNVREVMDIVNRTGDPKSAFYQMAEAKGVDPEAILSMIRR